MKKLYIQPVTERVVLNLGEHVTWGTLGNFSNPYNYNEGKQNTIIFVEEDFEEEPDTTSFWYNDPWKIKYDLWDEE
jgi:hypothetical protein